jgi:hypothetical protein
MNGMRLGCCLALLLLGAGCGKTPRQTQPIASASARPAASAPMMAPSVATVHEAEPLAAAPACRALRVSGSAKLGDAGRPLASGDVLDGTEWVTLEKAAKLTLKHSVSGRELSVTGPASFRPCWRGREQVLFARGSLLTAAGLGARPGAEVLIATPLAAVHYGDAELELSLDAKHLRQAVRAGIVEVEAVPAPSKPLQSPLHAKDQLRLPLGKPDATALVAGCKAAAERAEAAALRVTDSESKESLGERAQAHVRARQSARHSCMVAAAATGLMADAAQRAGLGAEVARWEALLERVPRRGR